MPKVGTGKGGRLQKGSQSGGTTHHGEGSYGSNRWKTDIKKSPVRIPTEKR